MPTLQELMLNGLGWAHEEAAILAPALTSCRSLQLLNLERNRIDERALEALRRGLVPLAATPLTLNLTANPLGVEGAIVASKLLRTCPAVSVLHLSSCGLTGGGVDMGGVFALAAALRDHTSALVLHLYSNDVAKDAKAELRAAAAAAAGAVEVWGAATSTAPPASPPSTDDMKGTGKYVPPHARA